MELTKKQAEDLRKSMEIIAAERRICKCYLCVAKILEPILSLESEFDLLDTVAALFKRLDSATQFEFNEDVTIEMRRGLKGERWTIARRGFCLNKENDWEYEPMPSTRTEEFIERTRFDSFEEASTFCKKYFGVIRNDEEQAKVQDRSSDSLSS